jgi:hypothetical protein
MRAPKLRALVAAVIFAVTLPATSLAQEGSGGKNVVLAFNSTDDRTMARSGVLFGRASGDKVAPENLAHSRSSCTDCRTVAVAMQSVVILSNAQDIRPNNAAIAVNVECSGCRTMAYAFQYVVSISEPATLTPDGEQAVAGIRARAAEAAQSDADFPALQERLDALAQEFQSVIDEEIVRPRGGRGVPARDVQTAVTPADC